jgi:predicted ester cyclase
MTNKEVPLNFLFYEMLPDMIMGEGDLISVIGRFGGTHTGTFLAIPPTGKTFADVPFHVTYKVQDGKIVDHWLLIDSMTLMQRLGLVPSAA